MARSPFLSRRRAIALLGGGVVLAAAGGAARFAATRTPEAALAPWDAAGLDAEPRRRALSWALLAPNPHNRQPWIADLREPGVVTLSADPARRLPVTDPYDRQIVIGMGCFIELMVMAAAADGWRTELTLFPEGEGEDRLDGRAVALARFVRAEPAADPLFAHARDRRSGKVPFDMTRPPSPADLAALTAAARGVRADASAAPDTTAALRALTWDAWRVEAENPDAFGESVALMRLGRAEIEANPDGIDIGGLKMEALILVGLLSRAAMADPASEAFRIGWETYRAMLEATPAHFWLATLGNTRADQIAAGRAWLRANLAATALGLGLHPVSQCLQEFAEMAPHRAAAHAALARPGETVQMLGRVGYAPAQPRTPRWPLETRIMGA